MINSFTWLAQCFELISQMNDMSQAHQENHTAAKDLHLLPQQCLVSEQLDRKKNYEHVLLNIWQNRL